MMVAAQKAHWVAKSDISGPPQSAGTQLPGAAAAPPPDKNHFLEQSPFECDGGDLIGRDPRQMTVYDWAGRERLVGLKAIRAKCLDCSAGQVSEVRKCTAWSCALWPLRMGSTPPAWRAGSGS